MVFFFIEVLWRYLRVIGGLGLGVVYLLWWDGRLVGGEFLVVYFFRWL